jgi:hypothetical protein
LTYLLPNPVLNATKALTIRLLNNGHNRVTLRLAHLLKIVGVRAPLAIEVRKPLLGLADLLRISKQMLLNI